MKKLIAIVIVIIIIILVITKLTGTSTPTTTTDTTGTDTTPAVVVSTSQTTKVSDKLSEYKNDELGFQVKYPTAWEKAEAPANVTFYAPTTDAKDKNTLGKLETKIDVSSGNCAFPPVTTIKERTTLKSGMLSFNMISMSNTVQGRTYFNRMYSLQKGSICYYFTFSAITLSPSSKGFSGAEAQKIGSTNTVMVDAADSQFQDLVKSFAFVVGPAGKDEATVSPKK
jgi:hypothetical protein